MIVRILLSLALLSTSIFSMLNGELVELRIVNYFIPNWFIAQVAYRVLIFTLIFSGLSIAIGSTGKLLKIIAILGSSIVLLDSLLFLGGSDRFGGLFIYSPYQTLSLIAIVLLLISLLLFTKSKSSSKKRKPWVYFVLTAITLALSFIRVVYIEDWTSTADNEKTISLSQANELLVEKKTLPASDSLLLPFFSTSCPYCRLTAIKLSISRKNGRIPNTVIVFPDNKEYAEQFLKETNLTGIPYINLNKEQFTELAGYRWPSVFFITKSNSSQYIGGAFNNFTLSKIEKK